MNRPRIIALTGRIGAGKTTAARVLEDLGYVRVRFAGPLKAMLQALGCSEDQTDGGLKEVPSELLCGKTPRQAMQLLGTEWGRNLIGDKLWLRAWLNEAVKHPYVVVDDARFANECAAVHELGGVIWTVVREGMMPQDHASEQQVLPSDGVIINNWSVEELGESVRHLLGHKPRRHAIAWRPTVTGTEAKLPAELDPTDGA